MKPRFLEIAYQSNLYEQQLALRDTVLRRPLGLVISQSDVQEDATQLHFGMAVDGESHDDAVKLIASVTVVDLGDRQAKIRQMVVAETHQRGGVGSELMKQTESCLRERGFHTVELNARVAVLGFYERLGYHPIGERFTEVTIEHQKMTRKL